MQDVSDPPDYLGFNLNQDVALCASTARLLTFHATRKETNVHLAFSLFRCVFAMPFTCSCLSLAARSSHNFSLRLVEQHWYQKIFQNLGVISISPCLVPSSSYQFASKCWSIRTPRTSSKCPDSFHGILGYPSMPTPPPRKSFPSKSCDFSPEKLLAWRQARLASPIILGKQTRHILIRLMTHGAKLLPIDFPHNAKFNYLLKMAEGKLNKRTPTTSYAYLTDAPGASKNARKATTQQFIRICPRTSK